MKELKENMKNNNSTSILLVIDRSGSMQSLHKDLIGGLNNYISEQKKIEGECNVSVVQFDTTIEDVIWNVPLNFVPTFDAATHFIPRGGTSLYDAIGYGVNKLGKELSNTPEKDRPKNVIVVIYSDGEENSSKEFNSEKVKKVITHQSDVYSWNFVYLGANQDSILNAKTIGISASNTINFSTTPVGSFYACSGINMSTTSLRSRGQSYSFSEADRTLCSLTN